jgi:uncharacterized protein YndB with AHSA1/START domain
MADYQFVTHWLIAAPMQQVWAAIVDSESWHLWWNAVESAVELEPGQSDGRGNVRRLVWKTPLGYRLAFETRVVDIQAPTYLEVQAIGDVEGTGRWELSTCDRGTAVCYTWTVRTTQGWMNALAAIARPLLEWNHNIIMTRGGKGLARYLQTELL